MPESPNKEGAGFDSTKVQRMKLKYQNEIQSMLFTFGDVRNPFPETINLLEEIIHQELVNLVHRAAQITHLQNARTLTPETIAFIVRNQELLLTRIRDFLAWRDVRKNVRNSNESELPNIELEERNRPMRFPWDHSNWVMDLVDMLFLPLRPV